MVLQVRQGLKQTLVSYKLKEKRNVIKNDSKQICNYRNQNIKYGSKGLLSALYI